jgi:hypothetical protein
MQPGQENQSRYCTLVYKLPELEFAAAQSPPIIALIILQNDSPPDILIDPNWRSFVRSEDLEYIESLFNDFVKRSKVDSEALFEQISNLSIGPLITQESGEGNLDQSPLVARLQSRFSRL